LKIDYSDYPALFRAADEASLAAQRNYLRLTWGTLILLVTGAALAAVSSEFASVASAMSALAMTSAIVLAVSLLLTLYLKTSKLEQVWYGGRAVAESVKSMMWRYIVGADPYSADLVPAAEADRKFLSELGSIVKERKQLAFGFGGEFAEEPQISERMRAVRAGNLDERKTVYVSERISGQRRWYGNQAKLNRSAENKYFALIAFSQLCALVAAMALVEWPGSKIKLTGLFTSVAAAFIAWLQIKQHKELSQSYSVAELELSFIQEQAQFVKNDRDLSNFVADAENAISREHTLWIARRDRS
jgi:conflict system pore-forming effector with SLATT domain